MLRYLEWAALGLALAQVSACADTPFKPDVLTGPALAIVAGDGVSDTISASFTQGLVVNVRGADGNAAAGVYVLFNSIGAAAVQVSPASDPTAPFTAGQSVLTDGSGRAAVRIRFQTSAGAGRVAVSVPVYKLADTASYTVLPGAAAALALQPRDTTIQVGGSFRLRASAVDRAGNARADPISFESSGPAATISPGAQVTGVATGSVMLRATTSAGSRVLRDSTSVTVVPKG